MSDLLFDRQCRVLIGTTISQTGAFVNGEVLDIVGMRVKFRIVKTLDKQPNTAEIIVSNLAEKTRSQLQARGARVVLMAGYPGNLGQIYVGDARTIDSERHGADWETRITAGDGEGAYLESTISRTFAPGTPVGRIVGVISGAFGVDANAAVRKLLPVPDQYVGGYTAHGRASVELDRVLRASGYEWSVQDGRLQILKPGEANTETVVVIGPESGLVGSPAYGAHEKKNKPPYVKVRALLSPEITPGGRVDLETARHRGVHRVLKVTHEGDTAGGDWYTDFEAEVVGTEGGTHA